LEGSEKVITDDAMRIICIDEDKPITECIGTVIEDEQAEETTEESTGHKEQEEKTVVPPVQMRSYIFGKAEDVPFKSLKELKAENLETRKHSFEQILQYLPQAEGIAGSKVRLQTTRDPKANTLKLVVTSGKRASEFKIVLDQVSLPDKINLHKQSSDILYAELLQLVVNHSKALAKIDKMELRIKQEQTASKSHQKNIRSLESDIITTSEDQENVKALQKLLDNKDKVINELKENLKLPPTHVLQTLELAHVEFDKYLL